MSKNFKNYKPKNPISSASLQRPHFQIPEMGPWDLTKLDNLHFSWDGPLSFNKT